MMSFDHGNPCTAGRTTRGQAECCARLVHAEPSATHVRAPVLSAGSPSRSSRRYLTTDNDLRNDSYQLDVHAPRLDRHP